MQIKQRLFAPAQKKLPITESLLKDSSSNLKIYKYTYTNCQVKRETADGKREHLTSVVSLLTYK